MEKRRTRSRTRTRHEESLDDLPTELMHRIQSCLSKKEVALTCVLSKSWHHAWSTIPALRFPKHYGSETKNNELVYKTIQRYHDNHVPIQSLDLKLYVRDTGHAESWFRHVLSSKTRTCLKELSLEIWNYTGSKFTFSDDLLFSGDKLHTIKLNCFRVNFGVNPGINPVIKCASLRVLDLTRVNIRQDVFHNLLSTCSFLEKVRLCCCRGLKTIKVKNLGCLRHLEIISPTKKEDLLEIDNVPSLGFFCYKRGGVGENPLPFKTTDSTTASSLGRSVTRLHLEGMIIEIAFFDMIESKFPFLKSLELLKIRVRPSKRLVITSLSLKRLTLWLVQGHRFIDLQVNAPNLLSFDFEGETLPTLFFPAIAPKEIKLALEPRKPLDTSFFLKLREVLNLSSKFDIHIDFSDADSDDDSDDETEDDDSDDETETPFPLSSSTVDVDDLRKRVLFPVTNVQLLSLGCYVANLDDAFRERTRAFDAFFSICHPIRVKLYGFYSKSLCKLTVRAMMGNNMTDLKDVQIKNPLSRRWEALTSPWEVDFVDSLPATYDVKFKLKWFSHD